MVVHRAKPDYRTKREKFVENILGDLLVVDFDIECARIHAKLWADLAERGSQVGAHDMLIGATCLAHGFHLATLNEGEFERIEQLHLADARSYAVES